MVELLDGSVGQLAADERSGPPGSVRCFLLRVAEVLDGVGVSVGGVSVDVRSADSWHVSLHRAAVDLGPVFIAVLGVSPEREVTCLPPKPGCHDGAVVRSYGNFLRGPRVVRFDALDSYADDLIPAGMTGGDAAS